MQECHYRERPRCGIEETASQLCVNRRNQSYRKGRDRTALSIDPVEGSVRFENEQLRAAGYNGPVPVVDLHLGGGNCIVESKVVVKGQHGGFSERPVHSES